MALKNIIITGSIGTYPTLSYGQKEYISSTDEQSFPIEHITGSNGGSMPDLNGQYSTTDLYVNITQSWDVVINTPVGLVSSVHDTQDEFINGEFSGSILEVTNQRLIDEDCEQFLKVSTVEVNYDPYFYSGLFTDLSSFINSSTSPNNGELYLYTDTSQFLTVGFKVTHIKINRYDNGGNDNTLSLQELTTLRLQTSTGILNFNLLTITEYPTYYLYTTYTSITFLTSTVSPDSNVLDHHIVASKTGTTPVAGDDSVIIINYNTVTTDTLGYFNPTTGLITFGDTPNIEIYVTASITVPDPYQDFSLFGSSEGRIVMINTSSASGGTITLSASLSPIENSTYWLFIENNGSGASSYSNVNLLLTQSISPSSSTNLTVLEPYLTENFFYNDCNSLYGNADGLEYDKNFMSVNYDDGSIIPSNQSQILNGTAERAPVKPYNYRLLSQIRPRYLGTKYSTDAVNVRTTTQVSIEENTSNKDLGITTFNQPSVTSEETFFAYFDYIGGTNYELTGKKGAHILYLIDKDGNTQTPNLNDPYYSNLVQNFSNQNIKIQFLTTTGNVINVEGIHPVIRAGYVPMGIIASQTGSSLNITSSMSFASSDTLSIPNYQSFYFDSIHNSTNRLDINPSANQLIGVETPFITSSIISHSLVLNTEKFYISASSNNTQIALQLNADIEISEIILAPYQTYSPTVQFYEKKQGLAATILDIKFINAIHGSKISTTAISKYFTPISGSYYYINIFNQSGYYQINASDISIQTIQIPPPNDAVNLFVTSSYFYTGSIKNYLISEQFGPHIYTNPPLTQFPITASSGYADFLPFNIKYGDQIRFEGDEFQTYNIIKAIPSFSSSIGIIPFQLELDRNIVEGTNVDSFLIRRYIPNPNFIIIDAPAEGGGSGFLFPEYVTLDIQNNFDTIIQNLKTKGILPSI